MHLLAETVEGTNDPRREVTEWVAHVLSDALKRPAPETARVTAEFGQDLPPAPMKPGAGRTAMLAVACLISLLGIVVFLKFGLIAIYVFAAAGVPAGIALGSQKKEFWM